MPTTLENINAQSRAAFVADFGDIAEHSPWVAEGAAEARPFKDRDSMISAFAAAIDSASEGDRLDLIRAHPDLATKASLTPDSAKEQAGVGLDTLTQDEFTRFTDLNDRYKARFGFPFIFAVKGATKHLILQSFEDRIDNPAELEFETALTMVKRIVAFRLEDRVTS